MTWKKVECPFEKDRKILQYLLTAPAYTEDGTLKDEGAMCKEKSQFWGFKCLKSCGRLAHFFSKDLCICKHYILKKI